MNERLNALITNVVLHTAVLYVSRDNYNILLSVSEQYDESGAIAI